jgi:hypothetical protein
MKQEAPRKHKGAHAKELWWKKRHPKNAKGLTQKTSDEKRGTLKMQRDTTKSHEGDITMKSHEGDITAKSHESDIITKMHEGDITSKSHEGEIMMKSHEGDNTTNERDSQITSDMSS